MERKKEPSKVAYIRLPAWVAMKLEMHGERYQLSLSDMVRQAIYAHYKELITGEREGHK